MSVMTTVKAFRSEEERGWGKNPEKVADEIKDLVHLPPFLPKAALDGIKRDTEFWLQPNSTGSMAHMDSHCMSTMAFTIGGRKRWRFQQQYMHPVDAFDGNVYRSNLWKPMWEGITEDGQAVVFPPSMLHEGLSIGGTCLVGMTYQFDTPLPSSYWRNLLFRTLRDPEMEGCFYHLWLMANFHPALEREAENMDDIFSEHTRKEAIAHIREVAGPKDGSDFWSDMELQALSRLAHKKNYQDFVRFHDLNNDGRIEVQEVAHTMLRAWYLRKEMEKERDTTRGVPPGHYWLKRMQKMKNKKKGKRKEEL